MPFGYVQEREQFGQPIGEFQGVSHQIADMATKLETSRYLIYRALSGDELPERLLTSMTKVHVAESTFEIAERCATDQGCGGLRRRDARILRVP